MNFDLEEIVTSSAAELFGFALKEASSEAEFHQAVEGVIREVMMRYPDISVDILSFALGRAIGRLEDQQRKKRH
jgi:hypothetical protein